MTAAIDRPGISDLADRIASHAHQLEQTIALNGINDPSCSSREDPQKLSSNDETTKKHRTAILTHCKALIDHLTEPTDRLKDMALVDKHNLATLQIINHFSIAEKVPASEPIPFHSLARSCSLPTDILTRIIRQAMTYSVFHEPSPGLVAHTKTSLAIPALAPLLSYQLEICLPSTMHLLPSLLLQQKERQPPPSSEDSPPETLPRNPFQLAHNTPLNFFAYAAKSPDLTRQYAAYQSLISPPSSSSSNNDHGASDGPHSLSHLLAGYDWHLLPRTTHIVDVGGGDGSAGIALAAAFENLGSVTVQDFEHLRAQFEAKVADAGEEKVRGRVRFVGHDFFEGQPEPPLPPPLLPADEDREEDGNSNGAAVAPSDDGRAGEESGKDTIFLLRHILHDWPTPSAHRILRNLLPQLLSSSPGSKLIVAEQVMPQQSPPPPNSPPQHPSPYPKTTEHATGADQEDTFASKDEERTMRALDLQMLVQYGSGERTREDWDRLFAGVGLRVVGTRRPRGSADTVMEVVVDSGSVV
ncbi:MAG: hypothetical protein Q9219_003129 [cf. Caloplaca sp. 3 TL-2023]